VHKGPPLVANPEPAESSPFHTRPLHFNIILSCNT